MYDTYDNNDNSMSTLILKLVGCFIAICIIVYMSQSCSRSEHNMIQIDGVYCYEEYTNVIYLESETGRYGTETVYTPYYNSNGKLCSYDVVSEEWVEINDENN